VIANVQLLILYRLGNR